MISGKPVTSATSDTCTPASRSDLAVPPVETRLTFRSERARAKSTTPVLSETEISARRIGRRVMAALLLAEKPKEKRKSDADNEAGDDRKVDLQAGALDGDVARQAPEPELPEPGPRQ